MKHILYLLCFALVACCGVFVCSHYNRSIPDKDKNPLFSVVLPTYNRGYCLSLAVYSVLAQTYEDFELIVVDDGSTDDTETLMKRLSKADFRIRYVKNPKNMGVVFSRNRGIDLSRGKYITFIDSDDIFMPTLLASIKEYYEEHPDAVMVTPFSKSLEKDGRLGYQYNYPSSSFEMFETNTVNTVGTTIVKQFLLEHQLRFEDTYKYAEDYLMWTNVLIAGGNIHYVKDYLAAVFSTNRDDEPYYRQMGISGKQVRRRLYDAFSGADAKYWDRCLFLQHLKQTAANVFPKEDFETANELWCLNLRERERQCTQVADCIFVYHSEWADGMMMSDNNRVCRQKADDCGTYVQLSPTQMLIKWDDWDSEILVRYPDRPQTYYTLN